MNFINKYPHDLCQKIARPGITLTFVSAMSPITMTEASDTMVGTTKKSGLSPARIIGKYGMNVNFSINTEQRREGADGSIEEKALSYMYALTNECVRMHLNASAAVSGTEMPSILKTEIKYIPSVMKEDRGASAITLVSKYSLSDVLAAINNIRNAMPNPRNEVQKQALTMAMFSVYGRKLSLDGRSSLAADYLSGQMQSKLSMCQNKETVFVSQLMLHETNIATLRECLDYDPANIKPLQQVEIYKAFKTPNPRKVDANGNTDGYQLSIICTPEKESACVHVELITMKGKPLANRMVGMTIDKNIPPKTFAMDIELSEWYDAISSAIEYKNALKSAYIKNARDMELVLDYRNRYPNAQPTQEVAARYNSILNFLI